MSKHVITLDFNGPHGLDYCGLKFKLDTKCATGKPFVVDCMSADNIDELETCNLVHENNLKPPTIDSLQLKLRRGNKMCMVKENRPRAKTI